MSLPSGFFIGRAEEQALAKVLVAACTNLERFVPFKKASGLEEVYFSDEASPLHSGYTFRALQSELDILARPSPKLERLRLEGAYSRFESLAHGRLLKSILEHSPAAAAPWHSMELSQLQVTTQPGNGVHCRPAHSDGGCHIVAISYNVQGFAVCGYQHNGEMQREMLLEPGHGWILCGLDVSGPTRKHYVKPSEVERVSLTFRYKLRYR